MRIGLMIGPERGRYRSKIDRMRTDGRWAEEAGFASVWLPQIPDEFDALTAAALVGAETSRIEVGTAVVPVYTRTPSVMAAQAASVAQLAPGRFVLGIGASSENIVERWGGMAGLPVGRLADWHGARWRVADWSEGPKAPAEVAAIRNGSHPAVSS